jgi:hypothetical protein
MSTTTIIQTAAGSYNWICPPGVSSVVVKLWGGGGGGEGKTAQGTGAGGSGGAFVQSTVAVTSGTTYGYVVAATTSAASDNGAHGNPSTFDTTTVVAEGGNPGTAGTAGTGSTTSSTGDTAYAGGNGANSNGTTSSGAGGGGAGTTGVGGNASTTTAGAGKTLSGGNGGAGRTTAGAGAAGSTAGGGGGGGWRAASTNRAGGKGAIGRAELSYDTPLIGSLTDDFNDNSINTAKWGTYNAGTGTTVETGQQMVLTPQASTGGDENQLYSIENYDLTGSQVSIKVISVCSGNMSSFLFVGPDGNNRIRFDVYGGYLSLNKIVANTYTQLGSSVAYSSSTHVYWRIRELSGTIYGDWSTDGTNWTNMGSTANPWAVTSCKAWVVTYEDNVIASPGTFTIDNFNVIPASGTNMQINIGDTWKSVSGLQINIGDVWKPVTHVWQNIGDVWKSVF